MAAERLAKAMDVFKRRYRKADRRERGRILDEFCKLSGYHRKYSIRLLSRQEDGQDGAGRRRRGPSYTESTLRVIEQIWRAAGYPWSERLRALLPLWLPWARKRVGGLDQETERQVLSISDRQIDRRLAARKQKLKRRIYGRTKPGTLLKHLVPVKAGQWEVQEPGFAEIDLVSHSGPSARGEFGWTLNLTDVVLELVRKPGHPGALGGGGSGCLGPNQATAAV